MSDRVWPTALVVGFLVVVAANATMIWLALDAPDPVVESYNFGPR